MFRIKAAFLLLSLSASHVQGRASHRRLTSDTNIIGALHDSLSQGIDHPRFTLTANSITNGGNLFSNGGEPFEIDVVLTDPSVSQSSSFSVDGGPPKSVEMNAKFFISDQDSDGNRSKDFSILHVDEEKGSVSGLVQKDGVLFKLEQLGGGSTVVSEVNNYVPPEDWECTEAHDLPEPEPIELMDPIADRGGRRLDGSHDHSHNHHHGHSHVDHNTLKLGSTSESIFSQVSGIDPNILKNRRRLTYATDDYPKKWSYQVDLYIEIDQYLVDRHDDVDKVNMPNTIAYVNALITASSSVYEREVDTHLHVMHIAKTNIYDSSSSTSAALGVMRNTYGESNWHYSDPVTGETPDLHHGIFGRSIGGGIAHLNAVCSSQIGYGLSAGIRGSFDDLSTGVMFWDLTVVMHELGHNFGSSHTHDYSPKVDACGNQSCNSLVTGVRVQPGEATIMSYCHQCGGSRNLGYTFGGHWNGGDRTDINTWSDNDGAVPFGNDPRRVSKTMYEHVSSRGQCVEPYLPVPSQLCTTDSECDDGNLCTTNTCGVAGTCTSVTRDGCCGNDVCEEGENGNTCSQDCTFTLSTPGIEGSFYVPYGVQFDIQATINDIGISKIIFRVRDSGSTNIKVYTAAGSYNSAEAGDWTLVASESIASSNRLISADIGGIPLNAGSTRSFYITATGRLAVEGDSNTPLAADENLLLLSPTVVSFDSTEFGSMYSGSIEFGWVGAVEYSLNGGGASPTTSSPTTPPSKTPTKAPSRAPTNNPTTSPSASPSPPPSASPSNSPSYSPSGSPISSPTLSPSVTSPTTEVPTASPVTSPPTTTSIGNGPQNAVFDSTFGVPHCAVTGSSCSSGALLDGRKNIANGPELNEPNTLDGSPCQDGQFGTYHNDESVDKVIVRAGGIDAPSNEDMKEGDTVTIIATVWAWGSGASDRADFYFASDAANPVWQYVGTVTPPSGGAHDLMMSYTLPQGTKQAVRVQLRYGGSVGYCSSGSYNDRDDLVFAVGGSTDAPIQSPVKTSSPTQFPISTAAPTLMQGGGPQEAVYDMALGAPRCIAYGSMCDSLTLVNGRGSLENGIESNRPNTLDACNDGNYGTYHDDESIDRIAVVSGEIDGSGSGGDMIEGGRATIIATVWPWKSGDADYADFYFASDSSNPQWVFIGTMQPTGSGLQDIKMSYDLPSGVNQAIRVNFRYRGVQGSNGSCSPGSYDDADDLAFKVKSNPSFVESVSQSMMDIHEEAHDIATDHDKRTEINANKTMKRGSKTSKQAKGTKRA